MSEYGLTDAGVNIKRLDTILSEMNEKLSEKWGVNTKQTSDSFLQHLLTNFADKIAELWEFGEDIYYSQFPSTAEGVYLDNAAQYSGTAREQAAPSYYSILCVGNDGTVLPTSVIVETSIYPKTQLQLAEQITISKSNFASARIMVREITENETFSVTIDGTTHSCSYESGSGPLDILQELAESIDGEDFSAVVDDDDMTLTITAVNMPASHVLMLSNNLSTVSVGTIGKFATLEKGDIELAEGTVTEIVKNITGLMAVRNVGEYTAGRLRETDVEFRQSYADKIFSHSSRMLSSIKSAILNNVESVKTVVCYENDTDSIDSFGRAPHSIEIIVDGGENRNDEIAQQILNTKAAGINTNGSVVCTLTGDEGEDIVIRFNRPTAVNVYFKIVVTKLTGAVLPTDYDDTIKDCVMKAVRNLSAGENVLPQSQIMPLIYSAISGIANLDITLATGSSPPEEYPLTNLPVSIRQIAATSLDKIEVSMSA